MPESSRQPSPNLLLRALSDADRALRDPHFKRISFEREMCLSKADEPIEYVYFPEGGIASITYMSHEGDRTEVGIFGRDGVSAIPLILGADRSPHDMFIQVNHSDALRIDADNFRAAIKASPALHHILLLYVQAMIIQMSQSAVANARHQIEGRLARWLLMCHDRLDGDTIELTHEFMAIMIGAQRSSVTVALHVLESTKTIRASRGRITILDRERLTDLANDSYGLAEAEYRRLLPS